jgi:hypothetical protein
MTAIGAVNDDNRRRQPNPVEDNANGPRLANDRPSGKVEIAANVRRAPIKMVSGRAWIPGIYQALRSKTTGQIPRCSMGESVHQPSHF